MEKKGLTLYLSENTIKWGKEKSDKLGISISTYFVSLIEQRVFEDYVNFKFEPEKKFKNNNRKNTMKKEYRKKERKNER